MNIEEDDNKFTWGDSVIIRKNSPNKFHPGEFASVCGFYKIQSKETAIELECQIGTWVYTVEFGDGSDIQVPECYLDKDLSVIHGRELSKYSNYFVNGVISGIILGIDWVELKVKSCFVNEHISSDVILLKDNFFIGKLVIIQIESIVVKNTIYSTEQQDVGSILTFEISDYELKLYIEWGKTKTTSLEIKAGQIWWQQELTEDKI